jgi:hypothetical protein
VNIHRQAEDFLSKHFINEHEGYSLTEEEIFIAGWRMGMGEAAGLATAHIGEYNTRTCEAIAGAILAKAETE